MKTNLNERPGREASLGERVSEPGKVLPPELAATVLAVSTVLLGVLLALPTYGIFLGWAAASLAASGTAFRMPILARCLSVGAAFGAVTLAAQSALGHVLGQGVPGWVCLVMVLAVTNPLMILLGRVHTFSSVPGMFIGFSTLLAVHLGGATPMTDSIPGALIVGAAMNLTGLGFYWLFNRMTRLQRVGRDDAGPNAAPSPSHAGGGLEPKLRA